jgi:hypothetical protein
MSTLGLVGPVALPAVAAILTWLLDQAGLRVSGYLCAAATWVGIVVLLAAWLPSRAIVEIGGGSLGAGIQFGLRLDPVSLAYELFVLLPSAVLLTFQRLPAYRAALGGLAVAAATLAVASATLLLTVLAWGTAVTLLVLLLQQEDEPLVRPQWAQLMLAWLALVWAAALLVGETGTTVYTAIPIVALSPAIFFLLAAAAVVTAGAVPWRSWAASVWRRDSIRSSGLAVAALTPLGFYLLTRAYAVGAGRYPSIWFALGLSAVGAVAALTASARAQAATGRREYLAEVLPGLAGLALVALALGTPVGVTASVLTVGAACLLAAALPLLPLRSGGPLLFAVAVAAGAPPSLAFAARLLDVQAALEGGEVDAFFALGAALAWVWGLAAAARAVLLPDPDGPVEGSPYTAVALTAFVLAAGAGSGLIATTIAMPAAAGVMTFPRSALTGGSLALVTASGAWSAVALAGPLLVAAALGLVALRAVPVLQVASTPAAPRPFFEIPGASLPGRAWARLAGFRLPVEYRSLFNPAALDTAVAKGEPWLWIAIAVAVTVVTVR